jgi:hypothetical protein
MLPHPPMFFQGSSFIVWDLIRETVAFLRHAGGRRQASADPGQVGGEGLPERDHQVRASVGGRHPIRG